MLSLANQQKREGINDLAEFIANCGYKAVEEALAVGGGNGGGSCFIREKSDNTDGNTSGISARGMCLCLQL